MESAGAMVVSVSVLCRVPYDVLTTYDKQRYSITYALLMQLFRYIILLVAARRRRLLSALKANENPYRLYDLPVVSFLSVLGFVIFDYSKALQAIQ